MVSDVDQKITKSFGGKKISLEAIDFLPLKVLYIFCFAPDAVQIRRIFFLSATLRTQNFLKESLYFDLLPGPFKNAIFLSFFKAMEDNKVKTQILFACKFSLFLCLQLFIDKWKCLQQLISINVL